MQITANLVRELREKTGVGMMDCKNALVESSGDFDSAIRYLREKGMAAVAKKADRDSSQGRVFVVLSSDQKRGVVMTLTCETDFVGGNDTFKGVGETIANEILANPAVKAKDDLASLKVGGLSFPQYIADAVLKLGENISVGQFDAISAGKVFGYVHLTGKIGTLVGFEGEVEESVGKDISMHIAAAAPRFLDESEVPAEELKAERDIIRGQALNEGRPEAFVDKVIEGRIQKYLKDICLLEQPFVKDQAVTIKQLLKAGTVLVGFKRFDIG